LKARCGWSTWQLRIHLGELEQQECIETAAGSQGKQYVYRLTVDEEGRPLDIDLSEPDEIAKKAKAARIEVTP